MNEVTGSWGYETPPMTVGWKFTLLKKTGFLGPIWTFHRAVEIFLYLEKVEPKFQLLLGNLGNEEKH